MDFKGLTRCVTRKDFVRYFVWFMELNIAQGRAERRATGANKQIVSILISDMDHLSTKQIYYKPGIIENHFVVIFGFKLVICSINYF